MSEITVILKDDERTLRFKFLIYEEYEVNENNPVIQRCIKEALTNFVGEPDQITIKISLEIS